MGSSAPGARCRGEDQVWADENATRLTLILFRRKRTREIKRIQAAKSVPLTPLVPELRLLWRWNALQPSAILDRLSRLQLIRPEDIAAFSLPCLPPNCCARSLQWPARARLQWVKRPSQCLPQGLP